MAAKKKTTTKKAATKKATTKTSGAKKSTTNKAPAQKATAKKAPAKKAPVKKASAKKAANATPSYEEIAQRAYEIYERRGGGHGGEVNDWHQAERELREERGLPVE